ncbi:MAG: hypothetical protein GX442_04500 [Candidatus Riflebacteria bacterium]|nr:hypothetical protein [Candidatus Riflebacteria bacterium]
MCRNPGLGIRALHRQGITGKGVNVAIIDQPLLLEHEEYKGKIATYVPIDCEGVGPQMHGAAVSSLLVGETCGTAPGASLFFFAEPSWKRDYAPRTAALRRILAFNTGKEPTARIRVVSVSIGFNQDFQNLEEWKRTLEEARRSGLIVIHCARDIFGVGCPLYKDADDPSNFEICCFAKGRRAELPAGLLYVPIDNRTVASFAGEKEFTFGAKGGLSWGAPYLAGVIALGFQIAPDLSEEDVFRLLRGTGTPFNGGVIVNPGGFIQKIQEPGKD